MKYKLRIYKKTGADKENLNHWAIRSDEEWSRIA